MAEIPVPVQAEGEKEWQEKVRILGASNAYFIDAHGVTMDRVDDPVPTDQIGREND